MTSNKTSTTTTSGVTLHGCTGSIPAQSIATKNIKCGKTAGTPASNPACEMKGQYGYGSWNNYETEGTTSIAKSLKKLSFTVNNVSYSTKTTGASVIGCSNPPGPTNEAGFKISGEVKSPKQDKGQTVTLTVCLGTDAGPNTTGTFHADFGSSNPALFITSAGIDPVTSSVVIS
ncbi:MAG TPA: hypothetical protein VMB72_16075 [Acidimicrobiales bacterium]|nr:hypothetical protein [Acidimicrobiales bacterium]